MDLEVSVNGQDVVCRVIEDPEGGPYKDARCEWASKLETRAREVFGRDPNYLRRAVPNRFRPTPKRYRMKSKRRFGAKVDRSLDRLLEKNPVNEAIREAMARGDYRAVYALKRLSR